MEGGFDLRDGGIEEFRDFGQRVAQHILEDDTTPLPWRKFKKERQGDGGQFLLLKRQLRFGGQRMFIELFQGLVAVAAQVFNCFVVGNPEKPTPQVRLRGQGC